jgi:hypothetical protein
MSVPRKPARGPQGVAEGASVTHAVTLIPTTGWRPERTPTQACRVAQRGQARAATAMREGARSRLGESPPGGMAG